MALVPSSKSEKFQLRGAIDKDTPKFLQERTSRSRWALLGLLAIWGPGLVVMFADTDVGSLITAAQSGTVWGYRMVLPQILLIPVLYVIQEITIRLGLHTGRGQGALIREHFGRGWAFLSASALFISAVGALVTELAGVAGIGEIFGLSPRYTVSITVIFLVTISLSGSYRKTERIGLVFGLAELAFIPAMIMAHPNLSQFSSGLQQLPLSNSSFLILLAANVGAVIMPWMIFYQQGAILDKRLKFQNLRSERRDTAVGAVITQIIMISIVVTFAATVGLHSHGASLNSVGDLSKALYPFIGSMGARVLLAAAVLGAALVASLVASLAAAWGLSEVLDWSHSLNSRPSKRNAKFYVTYTLAHVLGGALVLTGISYIHLAIDVEILNALLLPVILGFLLLLEAKALPNALRMHGMRRIVTTTLCVAVIAFGLYMIPFMLFRI